MRFCNVRYRCSCCGEIFTGDELGEREEFFAHDWQGGGVETWTVPICPNCGEDIDTDDEIEEDEEE